MYEKEEELVKGIFISPSIPQQSGRSCGVTLLTNANRSRITTPEAGLKHFLPGYPQVDQGNRYQMVKIEVTPSP